MWMVAICTDGLTAQVGWLWSEGWQTLHESAFIK